MFTPIPAIDIRGGRCVRLVEGDFARETVFGDDPVGMAEHWRRAGATRLHVVDLDGARDGVRANSSLIERIMQAVDIPVQVGGGVRSLSAASELLALGVDRVIVGTAVVEHPDDAGQWVTELGAERLIVAVDARDGVVATRGWQSSSHLHAFDLCRTLAEQSVQRVLYTDIARDGTGLGPNVGETRRLAQVLNVIGSGGVSTIEHLQALAEAGAEGAIIGTALYDGRLKLEQALAAC